ncbi:hypothetical protein LCGC14_1212350 [marine sediment metagenome]|uniref:Uncharacterized protein n=1 Tax=marine sediment metagenome TaxID=412755 RepID=A0A0F9M108_9ZZZZ
MKLLYVSKAGFLGPPAPWPGSDHDEPDDALAADKIASGFYRSESGKEKKERQVATKAAKKAVNTKAADIAEAEAAEAGVEAEEVAEVAETLKIRADAARETARGE